MSAAVTGVGPLLNSRGTKGSGEELATGDSEGPRTARPTAPFWFSKPASSSPESLLHPGGPWECRLRQDAWRWGFDKGPISPTPT